MPVIDLSRLLTSRTFWEILILTVLAVLVVTQMHRLDKYRGVIAEHQVSAQLSAINQDAQKHAQDAEYWKAQASQSAATAQTFAKLLEQVQQQRPVRSTVAQKIQEATTTDAGLEAEIHRVLPGVVYRLASDCR